MKGLLYLYPTTKIESIEILKDQLIIHLTDLKIIDSVLINQPLAWSIGNDFMRHIIFMGCAPYLKIEAESVTDTDFCHIRFKSSTQPILLLGENSRPPKCPQCQTSNPILFKILQSSQEPRIIKEPNYTCESCHTSAPLTHYTWQKNAGISDFFIEIPHIFPKEAIPSDFLLHSLQKKTNLKWDYFYLSL